MDLFTIRGIVEELKKEILGSFIAKIYQMNRTDMLFRLRRPGDEKQLLISTHPDFYRLYITEKKYANPMVPPRFCTYLRKHTLMARITGISQDPYERVVRLALQKKLDAGAVRNLVLVVELVGKGSNVLLLEGAKILDCLHFHRTEDGVSRPAEPGLTYTPPDPADRRSLSAVTLETMEEITPSPPGERWKAMVEKISGVNPILAREIEFLSDGTTQGLWAVFRLFTERYERGVFEPRIVTLLGEKKVLTLFPIKSLGVAWEESFPTVNQAADSFYFETVMRRQMADQKQSISKRLKQLLSRLQRRRENLLQDVKKFKQDIELKTLGDLLVANYSRLRKGMRQIEARDYLQDPPHSILIPLDEARDPAGNVEKYYKKYKKAKRGLGMTAERITETEREIAYLDSVLFQIEDAADSGELEEIRKELEEERILAAPQKQRAAKEKKEKTIPIRRFRSSDGQEIFCGKSNMGNDYLLRTMARGNDLWFHAQGLPGSHVLLRVGREEPRLETIAEAATIAAFYSRGRGSTRMPVDYTAAKNVHRPKRTRPGLVTYSQQKTIRVMPDKEKVQKLLVS